MDATTASASAAKYMSEVGVSTTQVSLGSIFIMVPGNGGSWLISIDVMKLSMLTSWLFSKVRPIGGTTLSVVAMTDEANDDDETLCRRCRCEMLPSSDDDDDADGGANAATLHAEDAADEEDDDESMATRRGAAMADMTESFLIGPRMIILQIQNYDEQLQLLRASGR